MRREYRLAAYALAVSALLLAASGAVVVADGSVADPTDESPEPTNDTVSTSGTDTETVDVSVTNTSATTFTVSEDGRTCGGALRVDDPNRTRTDVRVDGVTVTLIEAHGGEAFDEIDRQRFAALVWDEFSTSAGLGEYEHVELRVNQYYESVDREEPTDTVGVRASPADGCLPSVPGTVSLDDESVDVRSARPTLDGLDLTVTDTIGVLDDEERTLVERLVENDSQASYTVQQRFDDPSALAATVVEATNDGEVTLELTPPSADGPTVVVRIDLDTESVVTAYTKLSIESVDTDTVVVDGNETMTFEANGTTSSASDD
ncbi:hypothetical protein [Halomicrobium mukohataei]|uniref:Uncharacterized protein n=2 Tax=Halomicrobium mukohataei TaxID=57705 RepID=C7P4U2_HALMD|nr:hypothetical protein [Halomicrobium mukohataei]ACV49337.1 hypothetical protein Hmuk_3235 [Halomicrobium mukohataei DSM 12286]QCD67175.1 hypothetical protein E5139_16065 [Halomicrobium mukohataei]